MLCVWLLFQLSSATAVIVGQLSGQESLNEWERPFPECSIAVSL